MDSTLTQHLIESIHHTFESAFTISVNEIANPLKETLIYSKVEMIDDTQAKEVIIGMPKEGLVFLNGLYFGYEHNFSNEDLEDLIKELLNLIIGQVKVIYSSNNKKIKLEIPKIVVPKSMTTSMVRYFKVKDTYIMLTY